MDATTNNDENPPYIAWSKDPLFQLVVNPDGNIQLGSNTEPAKIFNSPYFTLGLIGLVGLILWSNRPK